MAVPAIYKSPHTTNSAPITAVVAIMASLTEKRIVSAFVPAACRQQMTGANHTPFRVSKHPS
jgi:hypothetical protein